MSKEIEQLESLIRAAARAHNDYGVRFEYHGWEMEDGSSMWSAKAYTKNTKTNAEFLLHSAFAATRERALDEILSFVNRHKTDMESYTVVWSHKERAGELHTSYFFVESIRDVVEKFFDGKHNSPHIIWEIKLNPSS